MTVVPQRPHAYATLRCDGARMSRSPVVSLTNWNTAVPFRPKNEPMKLRRSSAKPASGAAPQWGHETGFVMRHLYSMSMQPRGVSRKSKPKPGTGVDRSTIRRMLALTPSERLRLATEEPRNLERLKPRRIRRRN
jgi:hypothetical protein